ncbi:hypothetical protein M0805_004037 [Coniferiporia weirii]|nr:hypothetical protein M0805_004037 [Coniferiporia weirii]
MESLNMNTLVKTLPSSAIAKAEQDTMDKFKAAALSLTTLYRSSQQASKRHFDAGYLSALDDLLAVIQHGVSAPPDLCTSADGMHEEGMSIGRVMDWIEARQEAIRIKAKEDEEDEEEKEEKKASPSTGTRDGRDKTKSGSAQITAATSSSPVQLANSTTDTNLKTRTQSPPSSAAAASTPSPSLPTPQLSAPCASSLTSTLTGPTRSQVRTRARPQHARETPLLSSSHPHPNASGNSPGSPFNSALGSSSGSPTPSVASVLGAKRRHAAMLLDAYAPATASMAFPAFDHGGAAPHTTSMGAVTEALPLAGGAGTTRRRTRNSRAGGVGALGISRMENVTGSGETVDSMMDVEDEGGRERKRVSRR